MAVAGLGVGTVFAALPGLIVSAVPAGETGSAMSLNQVLRYVGFAARQRAERHRAGGRHRRRASSSPAAAATRRSG